MKKILFSFMLLAITLFGVGFVNAGEVTTEEDITRIYEEEIIVQSEDGDYSITTQSEQVDNFDKPRIIVEDEIDLNTLDIRFDDTLYVADSSCVVNNDSCLFMRFDTEQYKNYYKLFELIYSIDTDEDGDVEILYYLAVNKDGTGEFYKADFDQDKLVATELRMSYEAISHGTQFSPLNGEEIESWIANALENHLGWLLVVLGISAATLAGIIWGLIKLIFYIKGLQILTGKQNNQTGQLLKEVTGLKSQVSTLNKANKLGEYTASALNEIVEKSSKTDKERLRREYLKALQDKEISDETREQEVAKVNKIEKEEQEHEAKVKRSIDKIKENINKG